MTSTETNPLQLDNTSIRVLIVVDDPQLVGEIKAFLQGHSMAVSWIDQGHNAPEEVARSCPDAIIVGSRTEGSSGVELCRNLRLRFDTPIVLIMPATSETDCVLGLESGADDCLVVPVPLRELVARIRAHVRRARGRLTPGATALQVGSVCIEPQAMRATVQGRLLDLTAYEFKLLQGLMERAGRVLTREQLISMVRGSAEEAFDRSVDSHVSRLRHKLGDSPRRPTLIKTVRGAGYLFAPSQAPGGDAE